LSFFSIPASILRLCSTTIEGVIEGGRDSGEADKGGRERGEAGALAQGTPERTPQHTPRTASDARANSVRRQKAYSTTEGRQDMLLEDALRKAEQAPCEQATASGRRTNSQKSVT
jgi:hypothetical protein